MFKNKTVKPYQFKIKNQNHHKMHNSLRVNNQTQAKVKPTIQNFSFNIKM